jgi:GDP-fucose protein O-fucosyltransferase
MELILSLSVAMGRTIVFPPAIRMQRMNSTNGQKSHFHFRDFFPLSEMAAEHRYIDMISMQQFLEFEAIQHGSLRHKNFTDKGPFYPPGNRTDWEQCSHEEYLTLVDYLRSSTYNPTWNPADCIAAFPRNASELAQLSDLLNDTYNEGNSYIEFPAPVNGSVHERMHEIIGGRYQLCVYDEVMQREPFIHFQCGYNPAYRMVFQYYVFLFFQDWRADLWMKRFMRDHGKPIPLRLPAIVASHAPIVLRNNTRFTVVHCQ